MNPDHKENRKFNITRNLKTIELLKTEVLDGISSLFKAMIPNHEKKIINSLVRLIISAYTLGRRLGVSYDHLEQELNSQIQDLIDEEHEVETWFGDLSRLKKHLQERNNFYLR